MRMIASKGMRPMSPIGSSAETWPTETWLSMKVAPVDATTMSASPTKWKPPPTQSPLTAQITGFHTLLVLAVMPPPRSSSQRSRPATRLPMPPASATSLTSTPVWKARPRPVLTITRTSSSSSSCRHASISSSAIFRLNAFIDSGRLKISQPTRPRFSTISVSYDISMLHPPIDSAPQPGWTKEPPAGDRRPDPGASSNGRNHYMRSGSPRQSAEQSTVWRVDLPRCGQSETALFDDEAAVLDVEQTCVVRDGSCLLRGNAQLQPKGGRTHGDSLAGDIWRLAGGPEYVDQADLLGDVGERPIDGLAQDVVGVRIDWDNPPAAPLHVGGNGVCRLRRKTACADHGDGVVGGEDALNDGIGVDHAPDSTAVPGVRGTRVVRGRPAGGGGFVASVL